ncbi:MAG TPA: periplasmic heavy metal sensor [Terriglobales bacterium]|nr:periplasmic heavy metal sensor [Terriglobales bacterium]
MKTKLGILVLALVSSLGWAQQNPGPNTRPLGPGGNMDRKVFVQRHELGAWWKNSKVAEKLQLSDNQIKQLEETFYQHRLKLIDYSAEMEKADMKLQQMLDGDTADDSSINSQVDQVLAARGKVEREFTMMNLDFRKILTPDQWKQLRSMRGGMQDRIFFRHTPGPGIGGPAGPGPGPGPQSELFDDDLPPLPIEGGTCSATEKNGMRIVHCSDNVELQSDLEHKL